MDSMQRGPAYKDWRFPLAVGLGIGLGGGVSRTLEQNLASTLGYWGAFGVSVFAAAAVGGLVALVVVWLVGPLGRPRPEPNAGP